jgi:hypothetical protein
MKQSCNGWTGCRPAETVGDRSPSIHPPSGHYPRFQAPVGAVINFVRHRPWTRMVFAAISFLSVSGLLTLFQAMAA